MLSPYTLPRERERERERERDRDRDRETDGDRSTHARACTHTHTHPYRFQFNFIFSKRMKTFDFNTGIKKNPGNPGKTSIIRALCYHHVYNHMAVLYKYMSNALMSNETGGHFAWA